MRIEVFRPEHIAALKDHGGQEYLVSATPVDEIEMVTKNGTHLSFFADDLLVGCAGVAPVNPWRGIAWALMRTGLPRLFPAFHILARRELHRIPLQRIEAYIDPTFSPAARWVRFLGFVIETPYKPFFFPDGRGAQEWVRYNHLG